jgi:hypothetical protein
MRITRKRLIGTGAIAAGSLVSAGIGVSVAASSTPTHTLSFKSVQLTSHNVGKTSFINTGKEVQHGKFIGNNVVDGRYDVTTNTGVLSIAVALKGGLIYAHADVDSHGVISHGKVTGGSGTYKGITGTITVTSASKKTKDITITYH